MASYDLDVLRVSPNQVRLLDRHTDGRIVYIWNDEAEFADFVRQLEAAGRDAFQGHRRPSSLIGRDGDVFVLAKTGDVGRLEAPPIHDIANLLPHERAVTGILWIPDFGGANWRYVTADDLLELE